MAINYVICAYGEERFQKLLPGFSEPLIKVHGKTRLEWALSTLPIMSEDRLIIVVQKEQRVREKLESTLKNLFPFNEIEWSELSSFSVGEFEGAIAAEPFLVPTNSLVLYNCDTFFESKTLLHMLNDPVFDGVIPCSMESGNSRLFCREGDGDRIKEVAEKKPVSKWATVGFYFFRSAALFLEYAEAFTGKTGGEGRELSVEPLYNAMISDGLKVVLSRVYCSRPMGSPEEIQKFWNLSAADLISANMRRVLVMDMDNTITIEEPGVSYSEKKPNMRVIEKMKEYREAGYRIIIFSSRRMLTHKNDEAAIIADVGKITLDWLEAHGVPFDGLRFGKPFAENAFYVDDRAIRPDEFVNRSPEEIMKLIR